MANEAVIIELLGYPPGQPIQYTCGDAATIEKGSLLWFEDARKVSGVSCLLGTKPFAGVAAAEKVAGDGSTEIAVYTNGIFDMYVGTGDLPGVGTGVVLSGVNTVHKMATVDSASGSYIVGVALETASAGETIAVRVLK